MMNPIQTIPGWEEGDKLWERKIAIKVTAMAVQQFAESAMNKGTGLAMNDGRKTWQELVPKQHHQHGKTFLEQASERHLGKRKWDHTIELKSDALLSLNCRVYPLAPSKKEEQKEFLRTNLCLQRIRHSKSPYASRFFFIKKKDR